MSRSPGRVPRRILGLDLATSGIASLTLEGKLQVAKRAGYDGVELAARDFETGTSAVSRCREQLSDLGLLPLGLCPTEDLYPWYYLPHEVVAAAAKQHFAWATDLGCQYLVLPVMPGGPPGLSVSSIASRYYALVEAAEQCGLRLALEGIGHVAALADYRQAARVVEDSPSRSASLMMDLFHFYRGGCDTGDLPASAIDRMVAVQVADAVPGELEQLLGYRDRTFPGDGMLPVRSCLTWLHAALPVGIPFIVEIFNPRLERLAPDEVARRPLEWLHRMLDEIDNPSEAMRRRTRGRT